MWGLWTRRALPVTSSTPSGPVIVGAGPQITPKQLLEAISSPDKARANRAMQAMLQMQKIDVAAIQKAYDGG